MKKTRVRTEMDRRLLESEDRLRLALSAGKLGDWQLDLSDLQLTSSTQCKADFGRAPEDPFTYEMFRSSIHPEDRDRFEAAIRVAIEQVGDHETDCRCIWPDGSEHWIGVRGRAIAGPDGRAARMVGVTLDITERKKAEEALRQSEARKTAMFQTALDCIISMDDQGRIVEFNPAAERTFGHRRHDVLGRDLAELIIPPSLRERHRQGLAEYRATGKGPILDRRIEMPALHANGTEMLTELAVTRIPTEGAPLFTAYLRDITDRKRGEQRLATQYTVTRALAESTTLNEAAAEILRAICEHLGWQVGGLWYLDRHEQVLRCSEMYHPPAVQVPQFEALSRQRTFAKGVGLPGRVWVMGKAAWIPDVARDDNFPRASTAGAEGLHGAFGFPIVLNDEVLGVIEFFSHEIRQPDEDLLRMMTAIGAQIGQFIERKRAEEALKEADRRKDEFLATLAHELRNPLAPLRNGLQVMKLARDNGETIEQARTMMERQLTQMVRLIDDLLDLSRISRGKITLDNERVLLESVVHQAVETGRPVIEQAGHELTVSVPPDPIYVEADPIRLAQVFSNLLNNAAKFTDRGGHIGLTIQRRGGEAAVSIRDDGVGIPPDMLPKIFDMFTQVDRSLERSQGGLGIGLSLVRGLVEMHGGSVEARSDGPGRGSEFVVRLPVALSPVVEEQADRSGVLRSVARRRILVVDDNRDAALSLAMILRILGHETQTAHDGLEALDVAAAFLPDVILLDIGMPRMNGYVVARKIREQPWGRFVVLVALTGWGQEGDRRRSQEAGFNYHMVKPVEPQALENLLAGLANAPA